MCSSDLMLRLNQCSFPAVKYFLGTLAEMLFFGGLGLGFYGLTDHLVAGYMAAMVYYISAIGIRSTNPFLKLFYPFSMSAGSYTEKYFLFAGAVVLMAAGVYLRCRRK